MEKPVIIIGLTPLTQGLIDIFESNDIVIFGILDDRKDLHGKEVREIPVLSSTSDEEYLRMIGKDCEYFVASDENPVRKKIIDSIKDQRKAMPVNAIHKNSQIASSSSLGHGNYLGSGCTVGAGVEIKNHCIANSNASLGISSTIEDYCHIGQGAIIGNEVKLGKNVFVGTGATIVPGVEVGDNARIGAGSVVIESVKKGQTVFGNPAQVVK